MTNNDCKPTPERLRELLHYNPDTGVFTRIIGVSGGGKAGDIAGSDDGQGYCRIGIDGKDYRCHILAWIYMTGRRPTLEIDHRNRIRSDNRWDNLREATRKQNISNGKKRTNNTSGFHGVYLDRRRGKWVAHIKINYASKYLGQFEDIIDAAKAYDVAASIFHGEFASLNFRV